MGFPWLHIPDDDSEASDDDELPIPEGEDESTAIRRGS